MVFGLCSNERRRNEKPFRIPSKLLGISFLSIAVVCKRRQNPNWPQWRGADGQGGTVEKGLPTEWSPTKSIKWKTPISGRGHSSPIVWGKRIFLTTALDGEKIAGRTPGVTHKLSDGTDFVHPDAIGADLKHTFKVICIDRASGKILWERVAYEGPVQDSRHKVGSFASSTPATDGKLVFAFFGSEGLYAYDYDGKLIWKKDLGTLGTASVGYGVSPILYENLVIMQCDEWWSPYTQRSQKTARKRNVARQVDITLTTRYWSTPERIELVTAAAEAIISYDPLTGKEPGAVGWCNATHAGRSTSCRVTSGPLTRSRWRSKPRYDITDLNSLDLQQRTAYVPSPIFYGEYAFDIGNGWITCLDAKTGKLDHEGGRVPRATMFTARR